jgi:hypothetical protein
MSTHTHTQAHTHTHINAVDTQLYFITKIYTHIHSHTHIYIHTNKHKYTHRKFRSWSNALHSFLKHFARTQHAYRYICTCTQIYVHMYVCIYIYTHTHIHTCIYMHTCIWHVGHTHTCILHTHTYTYEHARILVMTCTPDTLVAQNISTNIWELSTVCLSVSLKATPVSLKAALLEPLAPCPGANISVRVAYAYV